MKKNGSIFIALFLYAVAHAQLPGADGLKNKVKDKAKDKAEQKANDAINGNTNGSNNSGSQTSGSSGSSSSSQGAVASQTPFHMNYQDDAMTEYHKQHVGQIIFFSPDSMQQASNNPNRGDAFRPTSEKKSFTYFEPLYCCFYLPHCLGNIPLYDEGDSTQTRDGNPFEQYEIRIIVDGKPLEKPLDLELNFSYSMHPNAITAGLTELKDDVIDGAPPYTYPARVWDEMVLKNLPEGTHQVKVEFWGSTGSRTTCGPVCTGEFTLIRNKGDQFGTEEEEWAKFRVGKAISEFNQTKVKDEGITSETHKNNVGKIVFSKSAIAGKNENTAAFATSFSGTDLLYARCYFAESLWNTPLYGARPTPGQDTTNISKMPVHNELSFMFYELMIDGKTPEELLGWSNYVFKDVSSTFGGDFSVTDDYDKIKSKTTVGLCIRGTQAERNSNIGGDQWVVIANALTPGEHTIELLVWGMGNNGGRTKEPVCRGEFKYTKVQGLFIPAGPDLSVIMDASPKKMSNPALEGQMKTMFAKGENVKTELKVWIVDPEWEVTRHAYTNEILYRRIGAYCVYIGKDGYCEVVFGTFAQDYENGAYKPLEAQIDDDVQLVNQASVK